MPKYVCDTEQVFSTGEKVCKAASDMSKTITNYSTNLESALSEWEGVAKKSFTNANQEQVAIAVKDASYVDSLGQFVKESAKAIADLESEISKLKI